MRSTRHNKSAEDTKTEADKLLNTSFTQAKAQFGDAVRSFWFYDGELCPGCLQHLIGVVKFKGKDALALNAFVFKEAQKNPYKQTALHADIERNLTTAYHKHLASLDA